MPRCNYSATQKNTANMRETVYFQFQGAIPVPRIGIRQICVRRLNFNAKVQPQCHAWDSEPFQSRTIDHGRADCSAQPHNEVSCCYFRVLYIHAYSSFQRSSLAVVEHYGVGRFYCLYVAHAQCHFVVGAVNL